MFFLEKELRVSWNIMIKDLVATIRQLEELKKWP